MTFFRRKTVGFADTLGDKLRRLREESNLTFDDVSARTGVQVKYLRAIEEGRYADLPGLVYAKNFVQKYAKLLEVREETALRLFEQEYAVRTRLTPPQGVAPLRTLGRYFVPTPQLIRRGLILLLAIGVLVYLGTELRNLTSSPKLIITSPPEELTTSEHSIELIGSTEPETTVTANGKPILVDRQGNFYELLDLQDGLNTIVLQAVKKRGSTTVVTRKILVRPQ